MIISTWDFGTAVMKCTPAHDPNDFALAKKYGLKMPICMNPDGTMNEMCHKYAGMDRFECREALVEDFKRPVWWTILKNICIKLTFRKERCYR